MLSQSIMHNALCQAAEFDRFKTGRFIFAVADQPCSEVGVAFRHYIRWKTRRRIFGGNVYFEDLSRRREADFSIWKSGSGSL